MITGKSAGKVVPSNGEGCGCGSCGCDPGSENTDAFHASRSTTATDKSAIRFIEIPSHPR